MISCIRWTKNRAVKDRHAGGSVTAFPACGGRSRGLWRRRHADQRETVTLLVAAFPTADALMLLPEMPIRLVEIAGDVTA